MTPPDEKTLAKLFSDRRMFKSLSAFRSAGFEVIERSNDERLMVGRHKALPEYLFKKYPDGKPLKNQLKNYTTRVEGARLAREFVNDQRLGQIVVAHKWLHELPSDFSGEKIASYVLIVERMNLARPDKIERKYGRIDRSTLKELCRLLFRFRGLDSTLKNLPFTEDDKIAIIDTERWDHEREPYLKHVSRYLTNERIHTAEKYFAELEKRG